MASYLTPGVYVEEVSTLPPSVAEVATAIPAFIGYTEIGPTGAGPVVRRINTMLEYRALFGGASPSAFTVSTSGGSGGALGALREVRRTTPANEFSLYYSLGLYFQNGGGSCYVVSVGNYSGAPSKSAFLDGLAALEKEDEPTLILFPDAVGLAAVDYFDLCQQALAQCKKLGDRFAIFDVPPVADDDATGSKAVEAFRTGLGINNLSYGAAYHPYLLTTLSYDVSEDQVRLATGATAPTTWRKALGDSGLEVAFTGASNARPKVTIVQGTEETTAFNVSGGNVLTITLGISKKASDVLTAWTGAAALATTGGFTLTRGNADMVVETSDSGDLAQVQADTQSLAPTLSQIRTSNTALYNQIKAALAQQRVVLPPSAAIAGVYASVDRDRGVWKAPANVSLAAVIGPVARITHQAQEKLNIDEGGGKSINAIRAFTGKGTLVWGARTLAGNDNEWRYIPVRRLFITIEESVQKSTAFAVFEPNDTGTWLKVKAMIESYLYGLWEQGALAGPTPEAAYFVNVGLGRTMTTQDVLEGRMIVEIGVAAVRPAEFIILRFMHKLQEA